MRHVNFGAPILPVDRYAAWTVRQAETERIRFDDLARYFGRELVWAVRNAPDQVAYFTPRFLYCRTKALRLAAAVRLIRAQRKRDGVRTRRPPMPWRFR